MLLFLSVRSYHLFKRRVQKAELESETGSGYCSKIKQSFKNKELLSSHEILEEVGKNKIYT